MYREVLGVALDEVGEAVEENAALAGVHAAPRRAQLERLLRRNDGAVDVGLQGRSRDN